MGEIVVSIPQRKTLTRQGHVQRFDDHLAGTIFHHAGMPGAHATLF